MREHLFRGKAVCGGEWVFGDPEHEPNGLCCSVRPFTLSSGILIDPATAGEFTGRYDKNSTRIFEGDRVRVDAPGYKIPSAEVRWESETAAFRLFWIDDNGEENWDELMWLRPCFEVIGNIYDVEVRP